MKRFLSHLMGVGCLLTSNAIAQTTTFGAVQQLNFDRPEAWALKYFTSTTIMSGLQPPEPNFEQRAIGSITLGLEMGWLPTLSAAQTRVGFDGKRDEDLNRTPILIRPSVRVGLPWRLALVAAAPSPFESFGIKPRLLALGVERPIVERSQWRIGWRGSGQIGYVQGAFSCPPQKLAAAGSSSCVAESADKVYLRYVGTEVQFSHQIPKSSRLTAHASAGVNLIDSAFQTNARLQNRIDRNRLWTRGTTFTTTAGVSYLLTKRVALTIDAFYSPLWVQRTPGGPTVNDGLFNVRALVSYAAR